ncbi:MAG: hypothetical protein HQ578_04845 [Chloroflexi bacterium]|nr:hypothetical protein [Chloroflexota bacterium]
MATENSAVKTSPFVCPKCRVNTQGRHAFCPECGEPWEMECPHCGLRWRFYVQYTYCPSCCTKVPEKAGISKP